MKEKINIRFITLLCIVMAAGLWRIFQGTGHAPMAGFTPVGAMALFGGAYFFNKVRAYLFPLLTLLVSDMVLMHTVYSSHNNGFLYDGWHIVYLAFGLMVLIGNTLIKKVTFKNVLVGALLAGFAHFIIVDFFVWFGGGMDVTTGLPYTRDFQGLIKCYTLALPFFKKLLIGNVIYCAVLFGGFEMAKYKFPVLRSGLAR